MSKNKSDKSKQVKISKSKPKLFGYKQIENNGLEDLFGQDYYFVLCNNIPLGNPIQGLNNILTIIEFMNSVNYVQYLQDRKLSLDK